MENSKIFAFWILVCDFDVLVKSMKIRFSVMPADSGSGPGQAPESSVFEWL